MAKKVLTSRNTPILEGDASRECKKCKVVQNITEFRKYSASGTRRVVCSSCNREQVREVSARARAKGITYGQRIIRSEAEYWPKLTDAQRKLFTTKLVP